jgi:hypothetical protein
VSIQSRFRASDATFRTSRVINSLLQAVRPSGMAEASGPESSSGVVAPDWNALEEAMGSTLGDKDLDFDRTLNLVDGEGNSAQFGENLLQLVRCNKCSKLFKPDIINEHLSA